ncbi:MAG: four helix bundle protein [Lysobacteraceae bacterium]|nr:MAG: four helix bundle protein [Xanthomonadaceae bacterium]
MHYRDAVMWNKAMALAEQACRLAGTLPAAERFGLRSQLSRAAVSVPSNVAEGWSRESRREKAQFLAIAQGSLSELHTQLLLCERLGWLAPELLRPTYGLIDEVSRMLTTMRRKLRLEPRATRKE